MDIKKFKKLPDIEGYKIAALRLGQDQVLGIVLLDKEGIRKYILRFKGDIEIEEYW